MRGIVDIIKVKGGKRISYIILFGSFARGDWIDQFRAETDGSLGSYNSDYDIVTTFYKDIVGRNYLRKLFTKRKNITRADYGDSWIQILNHVHFVIFDGSFRIFFASFVCQRFVF